MKAARKENRSIGENTDDEAIARALLVLMPDFRELQETFKRVVAHVEGLAKRFGVEDR